MLEPMRFLTTIVRYLHYTIGITTPRPDQERMFVAIWIGATLFIAAASAGFFFLLLSILHAK
jgi:hypothetical protein